MSRYWLALLRRKIFLFRLFRSAFGLAVFIAVQLRFLAICAPRILAVSMVSRVLWLSRIVIVWLELVCWIL